MNKKGSPGRLKRSPRLRLGWAALLTAVLLGTIAIPMAASTQKGEAIVQATAIKLRTEPGLGADVVTTLVKGTRVTVYEESGEWLLVSFNGYKGYVMRPYMNVVKAPGLDISPPSALSGEKPLGQRILDTPAQTGMTVGRSGQDVVVIQAALKSIGLFSGDITGYFGSATRTALMAYQKNAGANPTGVCDEGTYSLLKSVYDAANGKTVSIAHTEQAREPAGPAQTIAATVSERAAATPKPTLLPTAAPKATATAIAATATAIAATATPKPAAAQATAPAVPAAKKSRVELVDWWTSDIQKVIPRGAVFKVTDVRTGKTFTAYRRAGTNHSDTEPYTAEDTAVLKAIYGSWSWARRPIWVTANGRTFAASMNGMPHGEWNIKTNNYDGHFCIHFVNSRTHGTDRVDPDHQKAIQEAYQKGG